jgi:hypothetical protein
VTGSLLAIIVFGEKLGTGPLVVGGVLAAAVTVVAGIALLDTSPLVRAAQRELVSAGGQDATRLAARPEIACAAGGPHIRGHGRPSLAARRHVSSRQRGSA